MFSVRSKKSIKEVKLKQMPLHDILVWLEDNIRKPYLEGSTIDVYIAKPLKDAYCDSRKQN